MASGNVMAQIRKGMEVRTEDNSSLGTVAHVWLGVDPSSSSQHCDEETCSRLEVHLPHRGGARYIPYGAISDVSGKIVRLNVTAAQANEKLWHRRPDWLPIETSNADFDHLVRPHPEQGGY
ncbi:MAG TPA: hypothetical protein VFZ66_09935 [Herpetosiphonaceae bacterium]